MERFRVGRDTPGWLLLSRWDNSPSVHDAKYNIGRKCVRCPPQADNGRAQCPARDFVEKPNRFFDRLDIMGFAGKHARRGAASCEKRRKLEISY